MNFFNLVKNRRTIRKYKNKPVSRKILKKIIEAGTWAPSAHNWQPWQFIVLYNKGKKAKFVDEMMKKTTSFYTGVDTLIKHSLRIIDSAPVVIFVYNTRAFSKRIVRFGKKYETPTLLAEVESISAAIQNIHLAASDLKLGMAWLTTVLFIEKDINRFLKVDAELVAAITIGYPDEKGKAFPRKQNCTSFIS